MYAIRSYYEEILKLKPEVGVHREYGLAGRKAPLQGFPEKFILAIERSRGRRIDRDGKLIADRITSYNVCYTKLLRPFHINEPFLSVIVMK